MKWKFIESESDQLLALNGECFAFFQSKQDHCAIVFEADTAQTDLQDAIKEMLAKIGLTTMPSIIKLIGGKGPVEFIAKYLQSNKSENVKEVVREGPFDLVYRPGSGQIQVSKSVATDKGTSSKSAVSSGKKIKVLVVDDSATMRKVLEKIFDTEDIDLVEAIDHPDRVIPAIEKYKPDVITLDIHMPGKDGVTLLKEIAPVYKIPTVMITSVRKEDGPMVFDALDSGAVDYVEKPSMSEINNLKDMILEKIRSAASAKVQSQSATPVAKGTTAFPDWAINDGLIVLGASTGGTQAIKDVLCGLPDQIPPILIVQHIPPVFSKAFADRLNAAFSFEVKEAAPGDVIKPNQVLVAPGDRHIKVVKDRKIEITDDAPLNRFRPSVDYMFYSTSQQVESFDHVTAVLLTGMGKDGAQGMLELKGLGSYTIGQDEATSVVYGMPREAHDIGATTVQLPIKKISSEIVSSFAKAKKKAS